MKKLLYVFLVLAATALPARAELFVDAVFVKLSCYTPYQMPIPWFYYEEDASLWGEYSVYGFDAGLPWSQSKDVYGLGAGVYLDYGMTAGVSAAIASRTGTLFGFQAGVFNYADTVCGVQAGIVNMCERAYGIQIGLVNIIRTSPVLWLPILNAQF